MWNKREAEWEAERLSRKKLMEEVIIIQKRQLEEKMKVAAKNLEFEEAANLRDRIKGLRQKLVGKG